MQESENESDFTDSDSTGPYLPDLDESSSGEDIQSKIDVLTQKQNEKAKRKEEKARLQREKKATEYQKSQEQTIENQSVQEAQPPLDNRMLDVGMQRATAITEQNAILGRHEVCFLSMSKDIQMINEELKRGRTFPQNTSSPIRKRPSTSAYIAPTQKIASTPENVLPTPPENSQNTPNDETQDILILDESQTLSYDSDFVPSSQVKRRRREGKLCSNKNK